MTTYYYASDKINELYDFFVHHLTDEFTLCVRDHIIYAVIVDKKLKVFSDEIKMGKFGYDFKE